MEREAVARVIEEVVEEELKGQRELMEASFR